MVFPTPADFSVDRVGINILPIIYPMSSNWWTEGESNPSGVGTNPIHAIQDSAHLTIIGVTCLVLDKVFLKNIGKKFLKEESFLCGIIKVIWLCFIKNIDRKPLRM